MDIEAPLLAEYERNLASLDANGPAIQGMLTCEDVLKAHFLIANQFYLEGSGIGGVGFKSVDLLQSAVHRQYTGFQGKSKWTTPFDLCATLFYGLIKDHPFYDANKRTAFLSALLHLHRNNFCPAVNKRDFEDLTVEVAENNLVKYRRYIDLKRENHPDPEVSFISWWLRKNTRRIDKVSYVVTYRELKTILNRFGFSIENPHNNYIDVVKVVEKRSLFGLGASRTEFQRVGRIGFPRWTDQVGHLALKTVRKATKLDFENGVDSGAFFKGLDNTQQLITTYNEPLRNLAFR